ncbi:MAG TPA: hypothetical protein VFG11_07435 [Acidobacteriota bacterium]|nr:hypothetical protein [Acidobacteriota bacterium]
MMKYLDFILEPLFVFPLCFFIQLIFAVLGRPLRYRLLAIGSTGAASLILVALFYRFQSFEVHSDMEHLERAAAYASGMIVILTTLVAAGIANMATKSLWPVHGAYVVLIGMIVVATFDLVKKPLHLKPPIVILCSTFLMGGLYLRKKWARYCTGAGLILVTLRATIASWREFRTDLVKGNIKYNWLGYVFGVLIILLILLDGLFLIAGAEVSKAFSQRTGIAKDDQQPTPDTSISNQT